MFNRHWRETPADADEDSDSAPGRGHAPEPIDLAFVVGAIRGHAPELSDDLDDAITFWLEQGRDSAGRRAEQSRLTTRRSRLQALRELLSLSPYVPDLRD